MRGILKLTTVAVLALAALPSCVDSEPVRKPVPPVSENSKLPWNSQGPSGGGAQFGALPQNQYRR